MGLWIALLSPRIELAFLPETGSEVSTKARAPSLVGALSEKKQNQPRGAGALARCGRRGPVRAVVPPGLLGAGGAEAEREM